MKGEGGKGRGRAVALDLTPTTADAPSFVLRVQILLESRERRKEKICDEARLRRLLQRSSRKADSKGEKVIRRQLAGFNCI